MAAYQIVCIDKNPRQDPYNAIRAVGAVENGRIVRLELHQAIQLVHQGFQFYVTDNYGNVANVETAISPWGNEYLRTVADGKWGDNLLSLPPFPMQ